MDLQTSCKCVNHTFDWVSGMKMTHLYPDAKQIWAKPIPINIRIYCVGIKANSKDTDCHIILHVNTNLSKLNSLVTVSGIISKQFISWCPVQSMFHMGPLISKKSNLFKETCCVWQSQTGQHSSHTRPKCNYLTNR